MNGVLGNNEHVQCLLEEPVSIIRVLGGIARVLNFREFSLFVHVVGEDGIGGLLPPVDAQGPVEAHLLPDPFAVLLKAVEEFDLVQSLDSIDVVPAALSTDISLEVAAILLSDLFFAKICFHGIDSFL